MESQPRDTSTIKVAMKPIATPRSKEIFKLFFNFITCPPCFWGDHSTQGTCRQTEMLRVPNSSEKNFQRKLDLARSAECCRDLARSGQVERPARNTQIGMVQQV